jgi:hypothetical protein
MTEKMDSDATYIKLSIETILTLGLSLFVPTVCAAWALLHALIFKPLTSLKEEVSSMNASFRHLTEKQIETEMHHAGRLQLLELRLSRLETDFAEEEHRR